MAVNYYYMNIKGSTNIVGLIGHPVEHSFSPPMHNAAFDALGLNYAYVAFDVNPNDLKNAIGYISDRREPVPNIIKFNNLLYDNMVEISM